jgi:TfoX/Sxy family transcriptional regulator of competence genes
MFGRVVFMVNGKMCITSGPGRLMVRIDPESHAAAIEQKGVQPVIMRGREYKGFVHVNEDAVKSKKVFDRWIKCALQFNKQAAKSKRK